MLGKLLCLLLLAGSLAAQDEIKQLRDPDPDVRCRAAERLGKQGAASVPALVDALYDPSASVSAAAVDALARVGPAARIAVPRLDELVLAEPGFRARIDRAIRSIGRPAPELPALIRWLRSKELLDEDVDALDGIGRDKFKALILALRDGDARVQSQAALVLGLRASDLPDVTKALLKLRTHESAAVRGYVFRALVKDGEIAASVFAKELAHDQIAVRRVSPRVAAHGRACAGGHAGTHAGHRG
ncbi:MAG: HEAT repeat domain-containing protein [Planctomycetota bacterium]|jgi:HEAT repeat protein